MSTPADAAPTIDSVPPHDATDASSGKGPRGKSSPLAAFLFALAKRLAWNAFVLWIIFTVSFFLMKAMPGGPLSSDRKLPPAIEQNMRAYYGLDRPAHEQYLSMMGSYLRLDLGRSMKLVDFTVNEIVADALPISVALGVVALAFALALGLSAGTISAVRRKSLLDRFAMATALLGISIPNFVLASMLIILLCFVVPIFPVAGWGSPSQMILPALCLAAPFAGYIARLTRTGLMETLNLDFVRTARAKGMPERVVILKHALRGGITPVISFLGPATAGLLTGSVIVEKIFYIPGLGNHFIEAAMTRDPPVAMACVVVYAVVLLAANTIVDLTYSLVDPRVKFEG